MMKPMTLLRAMTPTSLQERKGVRLWDSHSEWLPHPLGVGTITGPCWQIKFGSLPALVPPNSLIAFGLKCCHDDIHIIVPISQHALLVGRHHSVWRQPTDVKEKLRLADLPSLPSRIPPESILQHCPGSWFPRQNSLTSFYLSIAWLAPASLEIASPSAQQLRKPGTALAFWGGVLQ